MLFLARFVQDIDVDKKKESLKESEESRNLTFGLRRLNFDETISSHIDI